MNTLDIIRKRRSVRTFEENTPSTEDTQKILEFAEKVENPYDIPITWKILDAKKNGLTSPVIVGTDTYIAGKMNRLPHAEEAFGYAFEKVVLYAESLGVGTTWIAGTMNREAFEKAMEISGDEVMPSVSPLGYPASKMSMRESMMRKGIRADSRIDFEKLFFDGSFDKPMTKDEAGKLADMLEAVQRAPSAVNKQPWRVVIAGDKAHFYEKPDKGYVSENGWDLQKIDLGIALCHFDMTAKEAGLELSLEVADPGIDTPEGMNYVATYVMK